MNFGKYLSRPNPKLANLRCQRIVFQPGDRVLVKVHRHLDSYEEKKLRRAIVKWTGVDVEVLIYNPGKMEIEIDRPYEILQGDSPER